MKKFLKVIISISIIHIVLQIVGVIVRGGDPEQIFAIGGVILGIVLLISVVYELFRKDGELRPKNFHSKQPARTLYDLSLITFLAVYLSSDGVEAFFSFSFGDKTYLLLLSIFASILSVSWMVSEIFVRKFWVGFIKIAIKGGVFLAAIFQYENGDKFPILMAIVTIYSVGVCIYYIIMLCAVMIDTSRWSNTILYIFKRSEGFFDAAGEVLTNGPVVLTRKTPFREYAVDDFGNTYDIRENTTGRLLAVDRYTGSGDFLVKKGFSSAMGESGRRYRIYQDDYDDEYYYED